MTEQKIQPSDAGPRIRPVLFEPNATVVATLVASPGKWHLIGGGDLDRLGTVSQAANRIKTGRMAGFKLLPEQGGFETYVASSRRRTQLYPVELHARFVLPGTPKTRPKLSKILPSKEAP